MIGFRDTNDFGNLSICKHEFKIHLPRLLQIYLDANKKNFQIAFHACNSKRPVTTRLTFEIMGQVVTGNVSGSEVFFDCEES